MAKFWISKYALTEGIQEVEGDLSQGEYVYYGSHGQAKLGRDAHVDESKARAASESMRKKKIASLKKQIAKLEAMKFD